MAPDVTCKLKTDWRSVVDAHLSDMFEQLEVLSTGTRNYRLLLRCKCCQGLYVFEYFEGSDWLGHDPPWWRAWVPVDEIEALEVGHLPSRALRSRPHFIQHYARGASGPTAQWMRRNRMSEVMP